MGLRYFDMSGLNTGPRGGPTPDSAPAVQPGSFTEPTLMRYDQGTGEAWWRFIAPEKGVYGFTSRYSYDAMQPEVDSPTLAYMQIYNMFTPPTLTVKIDQRSVPATSTRWAKMEEGEILWIGVFLDYLDFGVAHLQVSEIGDVVVDQGPDTWRLAAISNVVDTNEYPDVLKYHPNVIPDPWAPEVAAETDGLIDGFERRDSALTHDQGQMVPTGTMYFTWPDNSGTDEPTFPGMWECCWNYARKALYYAENFLPYIEYLDGWHYTSDGSETGTVSTCPVLPGVNQGVPWSMFSSWPWSVGIAYEANDPVAYYDDIPLQMHTQGGTGYLSVSTTQRKATESNAFYYEGDPGSDPNYWGGTSGSEIDEGEVEILDIQWCLDENAEGIFYIGGPYVPSETPLPLDVNLYIDVVGAFDTAPGAWGPSRGDRIFRKPLSGPESFGGSLALVYGGGAMDWQSLDIDIEACLALEGDPVWETLTEPGDAGHGDTGTYQMQPASVRFVAMAAEALDPTLPTWFDTTALGPRDYGYADGSHIHGSRGLDIFLLIKFLLRPKPVRHYFKSEIPAIAWEPVSEIIDGALDSVRARFY